MGNYTVKECPCEACKKARAAEQKPVERAGYTDLRKLAKSPAGDVVEDFKSLYHRVETGEMLLNDFFIHASAVAREGYVSLDDVLDSLSKDEIAEIENIFGDCSKQQIDYLISSRRARLAKPAERVTDEQKVAAMLNDSRMDGNDLSRRLLAKKIVAALKAGKHD